MKELTHALWIVFALATGLSFADAGDLEEFDTDGDGILSPTELAEIKSAYENAGGPAAAAEAMVDDMGAAGSVAMEDLGGATVGGKLNDFITQNFSIRNSFLNTKDQGEPARFSWTKTDGQAEFYTVDLAVMFINPYLTLGAFDDVPLFGRVETQIMPSFEMHTTTSQGNARDSMQVRLPILLDAVPSIQMGPDGMPLPGSSSLVKSQHAWITPVWELDRFGDTETIGGEAFWTPTIPKLGIGVQAPLPSFLGLDNNYLRWRPYLGVEGGSVLDGGGVAELTEEDTYFRVVPRVKADVWFGTQFSLTSAYIYRLDVTGDYDDHGYFESSAIFHFDDEEDVSQKKGASIGFSYRNGETTPQFYDVDTFTAWFGLKF